MTAKALITGASGFIGTHLCTALTKGAGDRLKSHASPDSLNSPVPSASHAAFDSLRIFTRGLSEPDGLSKLPSTEIIYGSLNEPEKVARACSGVEVVFHLAGIAHVGTKSAEQLHKTNVEGTRILLKACLEAGVTRLVYFSSVLAQDLDEDGNYEGNRPARVPDSTPPVSDYAKSKKAAEDLLLEAGSEHFQPVILRPVNVYGPGMKGNIAGLIRRIRNGYLPPLPRLDNQLPLVSVADLCEAALLAAQSPAAAGQIYTVTDGREYTPTSLESAIYAVLGRKKPGWHSPRMVFYAASLGAQLLNNLGIWNNDLGLRTYRNLVENSEASCEKISTELGYKPSRTFDQELPAILSALD